MLAAGAAMLFASPPAGAHALLVSSEPGEGVLLQASPGSVTLRFTEDPDRNLSQIAVLDTNGAHHETGSLQTVPGEPHSLRTKVTKLGRGVYTVSWRVVSRTDGHLTAGAYAFGIQVDPSNIKTSQGQAPSTPPLASLEAAGRFVLYLGLAGLIGASWVSWFAFRDLPGGHARLLRLSAMTALVGVGALAFAQHRAAGAGWALFFRSPIGRAIIERAVLVGAASAAAFTARARGVVIVAGLATIGVHVAAGHADTGSLAAVKVATQLVHFGAVTVWTGGLAALYVGIRGAPDETKARAVRRFSSVAGVCLAIVVGTGTARAVAEVGSWRALVGTSYGKIVLAKIVCVGVVAALAARNRWWNVPIASQSLEGMRRVSRGELGIFVVVLTLTGVLSSLVPGRSVSLAAPSSISLVGADFARTVRATLDITPGYAGANEFVARINVLRGSRVRGVVLRLDSSGAGVEESRLRLRRSGDAWRKHASSVAIPGLWRVVVFVDRGADSVEIPLRFHTRCRTPEPTSSGPPQIYDLDLAQGSLQAYVDPGRPGTNDVHFTFFDRKGKELPMGDGPVLRAFREQVVLLHTRRFSSGHFVGAGTLGKGVWVFELKGSTVKGDEVDVCFEDEIG